MSSNSYVGLMNGWLVLTSVTFRPEYLENHLPLTTKLVKETENKIFVAIPSLWDLSLVSMLCASRPLIFGGAKLVSWIVQLTVWLQWSLSGVRFQLPSLSESRMILHRDVEEEKLQQQLPTASTGSLGKLFFFIFYFFFGLLKYIFLFIIFPMI